MQQFYSVLLISTFIIANTANAQQIEKVSPGGTKFLLYTPPGYTSSSAYPLLVCLHGGGEIGDDLNELTTITPHLLPSKLISQGNWPSDRPFIVVSPQLKRDLSIPNYNDQEWPAGMVDEVIEHVRSTYNVTSNKIYLTGISLGGAGCWDYAAAYPNKVAAFVPISGKTNPANACLVKNIPIWAFHGEVDALVNPQFSIDMVNAVNACIPSGSYKPKLDLLHTKAHEGWSEIYNGTQGYNIFDWLLQFTKGDLANKAPYVNAGIDQKILAQNEPLQLTGNYFDSDGTISNILWTQTSGTLLTLEQTNSRFLKISNLLPGTFEFKLSVTDNLNAETSDGVILQIFATIPNADPAVTSLTLMNANGNTDIGNIYEGMVINKNTLGTTLFNIRATVGGSATGSVRYRINANQNVSTTNTPGPYYLKKSNQSWQIPNGEYTICATPYKLSAGRGAPGLSKIFKITVTDQITTPKIFYAKQGVDISLLSSWGTNTDGTGTNPSSFTASEQTFNITSNATLNNLLTISGTSSILWIRNGGQLTLNNRLNCAINTEANTIVILNSNDFFSVATIHPTTIFKFDLNATTIPSSVYSNLMLSGSGSVKTLSSGTTQVSGTVTIENNVSVNAGASLISIGGSWTNNGTFYSGTGSITFNGTSNQSITGSTSFNSLIVSKSNGNLNLTGTGPTIINNTLTLTSGKITSTTSNTLTLSLTSLLTGASQTCFIEGPIIKSIGAGGSFTFPVGSITENRYRPFTLENTSVQDTWTGEFHANNPTADGYPSTTINTSNLGSVSQFEYWNISRTNTTSADLTLSYGIGSYTPPNIGNTPNLRIAHWDGTHWDLPLGNGTISKTGDNIAGTIKQTHITSFSPQTIASTDALSTTPVTWLSFKARRIENKIEVNWKTATENNNDHFEVQRAVDGLNFHVIGTKPSSGSSNLPQQYHFTDEEVSDSETYYYRINQVDYDGSSAFSTTIAVPSIGATSVCWAIFPNPFNHHQQFHIIALDKSVDKKNEILKAEVTSPSGSLIKTAYGSLQDLSNNLENLFNKSSNGIYLIHLSSGNYREHFRIAIY